VGRVAPQREGGGSKESEKRGRSQDNLKKKEKNYGEQEKVKNLPTNLSCKRSGDRKRNRRRARRMRRYYVGKRGITDL